jgi:high affinity Mn2+ porin
LARGALLLVLAVLTAPARGTADEASASGPSIAAQVTAIGGTAARLQPERAVSTTATLWLGARLVPDVDVYLSPEVAAGNAPGGGAGLVTSPDADLIAPSPPPQLYLARAFVRWAIAFGPERVPGVPIGRGRHLVPRTAPARRLVLTLGVLSPAELLDQNAYANDPRSQFTHGAFVNDATWDFPQDVHGFSRGFLASIITPRLAVRAAVFQLAREPGGSLDWDLSRSRGEVVEAELDPQLNGATAAVRLRAWRNEGSMGSYDRALEAGSPPDLLAVRRPGATAWGLGLNAELGNADRSRGLFLRLGWKDGATEPTASGEADWSASVGGQLAGGGWGRGDDAVGLGLAWSGLSGSHARYLGGGWIRRPPGCRGRAKFDRARPGGLLRARGHLVDDRLRRRAGDRRAGRGWRPRARRPPVAEGATGAVSSALRPDDVRHPARRRRPPDAPRRTSRPTRGLLSCRIRRRIRTWRRRASGHESGTGRS